MSKAFAKSNTLSFTHADRPSGGVVMIVYPEAVPYVLTLWGAAEEYAEAFRNLQAVENEEDALGNDATDATDVLLDLLGDWYAEAYRRVRQTRKALHEAACA